MNGFTQEQIRLIEATAEVSSQRAVEKLIVRVDRDRARDLEAHRYSCPIGAEFNKIKNRGWGLIIGVGLSAGALGAWVRDALARVIQ